MSTNNLGTLTLDLVAQTGGFDAPLEKSARQTKRWMKEMGAAVDEFGNYTDRNMRKAAEATQQLDSQFEKLSSELNREIELYGDVSRAVQLRYDLESGALKALSAEQKQALLSQASRLEAMDRANQAFREQAAAAQSAAKAQKQIDAQFEQTLANLQRQIALQGKAGQAAALRYETERGALKALSAEQKRNLLETAAQVDALQKGTGSMRGFRGVATGLGYQVQDVAVQLQMGTNAMMVLGQQGSQVASLFGPTGAIVGAFIAVAGAAAGALIPSLLNTGKTAEEVAERVEGLTKNLEALDLAQREIVATGREFTLDDRIKEYEELGSKIDEQILKIQQLKDEEGTLRFISTGSGGTVSGASIGQTVAIDNTQKLEDATRDLTNAELERVEVLLRIQELQDPSNSAETIRNLNKELELIGLTGEQLYEKEAAQKGLIEGAAVEYVALKLLIEAKEEELKLEKERKKEAEEALKRAERQREAIEKAIKAMEREADLYGITSRAAQAKYDIEKGIIEIQGGLASVEAERYITAAKRIDQMKAEADATKEYVDALRDWVKTQREAEKDVEKIIEELKKQELQLGMTSEAYLIAQLRAKNATEAQIEEAVRLSRNIKQMQTEIAFTERVFERLDNAAANMWVDLIEGTDNAMDSIRKLFVQTVAEMAHEAWTKPIILRFQQSMMGGLGGVGGLGSAATAAGGPGATTTAAGTASQGGMYGAIAAAVIVGVSIWNKKQDEKFAKISAEYRQATQSMGTVLGEANKKSESLNNSIEILSGYADDSLGVNVRMLNELIQIKNNIGGFAAGIAREFGVDGLGDFSSIKTGTTTFGGQTGAYGILDAGPFLDSIGIFGEVGDFVAGFADGITAEISKAIYNKKVKIKDSGIKIIGQSLVDILESGIVEAYAYADVNTKKKFLGVTTSNKMKEQLSDLDAALLSQFGSVFESASEALSLASETFGIDFDKYIENLQIDTSKLSLKGLEGDALVAEIEAFFSSTLDGWTEVLLGESVRVEKDINSILSNVAKNILGVGTAAETVTEVNSRGLEVLREYQQVGEGAFETFIRLASETEAFLMYVDRLNLSFNVLGLDAVEATQEIAKLSGGFDKLSESLGNYAEQFLNEAQKFDFIQKSVAEAYEELNLAVPQTRQQFVDMVEALDLTTVAGQEQFAALMRLVGITDAYIDALEEEEKVREDLMRKALDSAFSKFNEAVQKERALLDELNEKSVASLQKSLSEHQQVAGALTTALGSMSLQSSRFDLLTRRAAQAQLISAGAIFRAGGGLPRAGQLDAALEVLARPSEQLFSTFEEYARDFYVTQNTIKELQEAAVEQVSADEQALLDQEEYHEEQMERFDDLLAFYQEQIDQLNDVDTSVLTVAEAVNELIDLLREAGVTGPLPTSESAGLVTATEIEEAMGAASGDGTSEKTGSSLQYSGYTATDLGTEVKGLRKDLEQSQYYMVKHVNNIYKLMERWDVDGVPVTEAEE